MTTTSYEWDLTQQIFKEVLDPTSTIEASDVNECIRKAGYQPEISSDAEDDVSATVKIYATDRPGQPRFYIDVMGQNSGIATFVARDFLSLLETLKQLHPLLTMIGLDQSAIAQMRSVDLHLHNRQ